MEKCEHNWKYHKNPDDVEYEYCPKCHNVRQISAKPTEGVGTSGNYMGISPSQSEERCTHNIELTESCHLCQRYIGKYPSKSEEKTMEDCQVCGNYICKCPVKEFVPPTESWEKGLSKWIGNFIDGGEDMDVWWQNDLKDFIRLTLQKERDKMVEEIKKLHVSIYEDGTGDYEVIDLDKVLEILQNYGK